MAATLGDLLPRWARRFEGLLTDLKIVIVNRRPEILKGDLNDGLRDTVLQSFQQRLVPIQVITGAAAQVGPNHLAYQHNDQVYTLPTRTIIWTTGNRVNPVIADLPLPAEQKDRAGRLRVLPTLQVPGYPTVFAGGDCTVLDHPQPATAQVAYQQGMAIAANLTAVAQHHPPQPVQVALRGTLIKLGQAEGAASLFDRITITGRRGHLIRQGTYLSLLPNPAHNFNAIVSWLSDELFQRHTLPPTVVQPSLRSRLSRWAARGVLGVTVAVGGLLMWRAIAPAQFDRLWRPIGMPALMNGEDESREQHDRFGQGA
jgi:NADH dehydrogenase FAD-containing subunit